MNTFYLPCAYFERLFFLLAFWVVYCSSASATLICPPNQTITAPPQSCEATLDFGSLVWSSSVPLTDTVFNPGPGHVFPLGLTPVSLTGVEVGGGIVTCAFTVTVQGNNNPQMACEYELPVFLETNCTKTITLDMMLVGIYGCPSNYTIARLTPMGSIISPAIMDEGDVGETVTIKVTNSVNGQSCWGSVEVVPYGLPLSITCPPDTIIDCNKEPLPANSGEASYFSCLPAEEVSLTYLDSYTDLNCGDDLVGTIARFWKATDLYSNERICTQNIQVRRNTLSQVSLPHDTVFSCSAVNANPQLTDPAHAGLPAINGFPINSSCDLSYDYEDLPLSICEGSIKIVRSWTVVDWCNTEVVQHTQIIKVLDTEGPVIQLADTIFISTNPVCGLDAIFPEAVVTDDCSSFMVEVITPWDTIEGNGGLTVAAAPAGSYPGKYLATDDCGNIAQHPIVIKVQDGTLVSCPPNTTIDCDFFIENLEAALAAEDYGVLEQFGEMQFYANCLTTPTESVSLDITDCSSGTITRTLGAEELPDQCTQTISVVTTSDFVVDFPADITVNCDQVGNFPTDEPVLFGVSCEQIETSFTDEVFTVVPDACYKIVRTWVVQNTCISTGSDTAPDINESSLGFPECDLNGDNSCSIRTVKAGADGYVSFQQVIKVIDNIYPVFVDGCEIPTVCLDSCTGLEVIILPSPAVDECYDYSITTQILIGGVWIGNADTIVGLAPDLYYVRYTAYDNCNNQTDCMAVLEIAECTPPTAICENNHVITIGNNGIERLYANELGNNSFDNCEPDPTFSFSEDGLTTYLDFTCADLGIQNLTVWVTDASGNQSTCQSQVEIETAVDCSQFLYSGNISTEDGLGVGGVEVHYYQNLYATTDSDGNYQIAVIGFQNTDLTPFLDENHGNGVSTFDKFLILRHILGTQLLDSPYKMIAADVNGSMSITAFDLVLMQKVILGTEDRFPNMTSWRFVPADFVFPNPANPFNLLLAEQIWAMFPAAPGDLDFIAIKIGDVNGSADPNLNPKHPASKSAKPKKSADD